MDMAFLLRACGFDPTTVAYCLHKPAEPRARLALLAMAESEPDLFDAYQSTHPGLPEATLKSRAVKAAFVSRGDGTQVFVGLFRQAGWRETPAAEIDALPAFRAMFARIGGIPFAARGIESRALFRLEPLPDLADLRGRLVVTDPGARAYMRRPETTPLPVLEITRTPDLTPPLPDWRDLVLDTPTLRALPARWAETLRHWRGIYLIIDRIDGARYVGAAYGADNLLGRWRAHVAGEAGVTLKLARRNPESFVFSILDLLSPAATIDEVAHVEQQWMRRLHTREHGLNS